MINKTLLAICLIISTQIAYANNARVSIFLFLKGQPLTNIDVYESDNKIATTDVYGDVELVLTSGQHLISFKSDGKELYQHEFNLSENEIIQLLIDFTYKNEQPIIDIESSQRRSPIDSPIVKDKKTPSAIITTLSGQILSAENQKVIANARIFISGIAASIITDAQGQFTTELNTGTYNVSVLHAQFNSQIKANIEINAEGIHDLVIELTPAGAELPEFVVVVPFIEGSLASVLEERKQNNSVANYLSMEQISKSGDSDAAGALKRVTGLTLVDGKFIFVRGLGERYSSTLLNGANLPSPDPTRRVVPLDLFPTGIIESIEVQKGYAATLPAEFGGGTVILKTINIPQSNFLKIGLSYAHNTQTTGKNGLSYQGGGRDWTGFDDGSRDIPQLLLTAIEGNTELRPSNPFIAGGFTPEELERIGESLSNNYSLENETIDPGLGFSLSTGLRKDLDSGVILGFSSALEYGSEYQTRSELRRDFIISTGDNLALDSEENSLTTKRNINLSGFLTTGIEFSENNKISANYMVLRNTQDFNEIAEGFNEDLGNSRRIFELRWTERELASFQTFGEHTFKNLGDIKLNWQY
ncbi:MAG: carboxypeptidase regulatory-like domain-containing protein, partial [Alcanivoracaceae bacterium]|nr:carboxypeptidase regulatory-like domain-containing protein [Alcanivoracaceae bacterium]